MKKYILLLVILFVGSSCFALSSGAEDMGGPHTPLISPTIDLVFYIGLTCMAGLYLTRCMSSMWKEGHDDIVMGSLGFMILLMGSPACISMSTGNAYPLLIYIVSCYLGYKYTRYEKKREKAALAIMQKKTHLKGYTKGGAL